MDLFCGEWQVRNTCRDCLLLGDELRAHLKVAVVRSAVQLGMVCWWLVSNTSYFLQVLDDKYFVRLKSHMPVLSDQKVIEAMLNKQSARDRVLHVTYDAERMIFSPTTIRTAMN